MAAAFLLGAGTLPSAGETLLTYTFPTNNAAGLQPDFLIPGLNATAVTPNGAFQIFGAQDGSNDAGLNNYATAPVLRLGPKANATNLAGALAEGSFFSMTLTPDVFMSLDSLSFLASKGGSGDRGFAIFSDATGFDVNNATSFGAGDALLHVGNILTTRNFNSPDSQFFIDLSAHPGLQDLEDPATFYFYVFAPQPGNSIEFDNFEFTGIVPEPSRALLMGVGVLLLLVRRRR